MANPKPTPSVTSSKLHPIVDAVTHFLAARDCLREAVSLRTGDDATADAGRFAEAMQAMGGALPDESEPWDLKHALEPTPGIVDAGGADLLERFAHVMGMMIRAGERAKALGLGPQRLLARFASLAQKHGSRNAALDAMRAASADDERARQAEHKAAADLRGDPRLRNAVQRPAGPNPPAQPPAKVFEVG